MQPEHPISLLLYVTFGVVLLLAVLALLHFRRKRSNREPMAGERERNIKEIRREGPDA